MLFTGVGVAELVAHVVGDGVPLEVEAVHDPLRKQGEVTVGGVEAVAGTGDATHDAARRVVDPRRGLLPCDGYASAAARWQRAQGAPAGRTRLHHKRTSSISSAVYIGSHATMTPHGRTMNSQPKV